MFEKGFKEGIEVNQMKRYVFWHSMSKDTDRGENHSYQWCGQDGKEEAGSKQSERRTPEKLVAQL